MNFLSCFFFFFVIQFSLTDIKTVQHEAKNSSSQPQAERDGREKILRTASEREEKKKEKAGGLNLFSFCKLEEEKQEALDALCVFSFVLRQSF